MKKILCGLVIVASLSACANPLNRHTYGTYIAAGDQAAERGDLQLAKKNYSRAVQNAWVGHLSAQETANALFKYARILGNLCEHTEAEKWFIEANKSNEEANGPGSEKTYVTLAEIGQLNYDIGRYERAIPYFEKALAVAEKYQLDTKYPASFADVYADYADALKQTGNNEKAKQALGKAASLKKTQVKNPEPAYTRYPKSCK